MHTRRQQAQELRNNAMARYLAAADEVLRDGAAPAGEGDQALLLASTSTGAPEAFDGQGNASGSGSSSALSSRGGSMFASMTLSRPAPMAGVVSLGRAARVVLGAFADAAKSVPMARPRLARPSGRRQ